MPLQVWQMEGKEFLLLLHYAPAPKCSRFQTAVIPQCFAWIPALSYYVLPAIVLSPWTGNPWGNFPGHANWKPQFNFWFCPRISHNCLGNWRDGISVPLLLVCKTGLAAVFNSLGMWECRDVREAVRCLDLVVPETTTAWETGEPQGRCLMDRTRMNFSPGMQGRWPQLKLTLPTEDLLRELR